MAKPVRMLLPAWMAVASSLPIFLSFGGQADAAGVLTEQRPPLAEADAKAISALHLAGAALGNRELTNVRGGFDPAPGVTLNFGFLQATYSNHQLIQSILVPNTNIALSSAAGLIVAQQPTGDAAQLPAQVLPGPAVTAPAFRAGSPNAIGAPTILTSQNLTTVMSDVQPTGITSVIKNTANGQLIQQITAVNIGITGLNQLISRQNQALSLTNTLAQGHVLAHN